MRNGTKKIKWDRWETSWMGCKKILVDKES